MSRFELGRTYRFEAAHRNTLGAGKTARLHGHNYLATVILEDECDPGIGWFIDYGDIDKVVRPVIANLDHCYLNEAMETVNTLQKDIEEWIYKETSNYLKSLKLVKVEIEGDLDFMIRRMPQEPDLGYPERIGFGFESAHSLPKVPGGHKCNGIHGHSFRMEAASADLEILRQSLREIYEILDHHYLNEIEGLENPTSENIAQWTWSRLSGKVEDLSIVIVRETPLSSCVYRG